jgi:hypothetical protein
METPNRPMPATPTPVPGQTTPPPAPASTGAAPTLTPALAPTPVSGNGAQASTVAGTPPTEDELRRAKAVMAAAKAHGVKLSTGSGAGGSPRIMLPTGETRQAYIQRRWKDGASRTLILKEIQSAGPPHDKCTYQIVFTSTKNLDGGPNHVAGGSDAVRLVPPSVSSPQQPPQAAE